ncbi:SdrD B-like domain-containing protein, partial [Anaerolineales bacterium HSG24]|nr:SdrD B-like domain-containing protein [Anaerolineales bacterium HSG24]
MIQKRKLWSLISLFAMLLNIFTPFIQVVHAAEYTLDGQTLKVLETFRVLNSDVPALSVLDTYMALYDLKRQRAASHAPMIEQSPAYRPNPSDTIGLVPPAFIRASSTGIRANSTDIQSDLGNINALRNGLEVLASSKVRSSLEVMDGTVPPSTLLPNWFNDAETSSKVRSSLEVMPNWFNNAKPPQNPESKIANPNSLLPDWFNDAEIANPKSKTLLPPARPLLKSVPEALLDVNVEGPDVASLGSPVGSGEIYTVTVTNNSEEIAYRTYFTAEWPSFFIFDGFLGATHSVTSVTSSIPMTVSTNGYRWTPTSTMHLKPKESIILTFKLRATCGAESAQQMRANIFYDADKSSGTSTESNSGGLNITTGRGNLVIRKDPAIVNLTSSDLGKPITWIVTVQNTGLGILYDATIFDTGGINLSQPTGDLNPSATIASLNINEKRTYTVVGTVDACNFTNVAQGSWLCGNEVGDGTVITPVESTATAMFDLVVPGVYLDVDPMSDFGFCRVNVTQTISLSVKNSGSPVKNLYIDSDLESNGAIAISLTSVSSGWIYNSGTFTYNGGVISGFVSDSSENPNIPLQFVVSTTGAVCNAGAGSVNFTPYWNDMCDNSLGNGDTKSTSYGYDANTIPTLAISKIGPKKATTGEAFSYTIDLTVTSAGNIDGVVMVTDIIPSGLILQSVDNPTLGSAAMSGTDTVTWTFNPSTPGDHSGQLKIGVKVSDAEGDCPAGSSLSNEIMANAKSDCADCPNLTASANVATVIANAEGIVHQDGGFVGSDETCGIGDLIIYNVFQVPASSAITWSNTVYTDGLGITGAGAVTEAAIFEYISDTLEWKIEKGGFITDYASDIISSTPNGMLRLDLTGLEATDAPTSDLTIYISYTLRITDTAFGDAETKTFNDWNELKIPNTNLCSADDSYNNVVAVTVKRGKLDVGLSPSTLDRCATNPVYINVTGGNANYESDHLVITFTGSNKQIASAVEHIRAEGFTTTGVLTTIPVTVISNATMITFVFEAETDITGTGSVWFNVDIDCNDNANFTADISYQTRCDTTYTDQATLNPSYNQPELVLFVTPVKYTVREDEVVWKFYIANSGSSTATDVLITNTIRGLTATSYQIDDGLDNSNFVPPILPIDGVYADTDVVFTITELAPFDRRKVVVTASVGTCSPLSVTIKTSYGCFGEVCQIEEGEVEFDTPDPYLLTNNYQTADLPMCDLGILEFTTKNASPDVALYEVYITETLEALTLVDGEPITVTVYDENQNQITQTTKFTPEITPDGNNTILLWKPISSPTSITFPNGILNNFQALNYIKFELPVRTTCLPNTTPKSHAEAFGKGPCGQNLSYVELARTLKTLQPQLNVEKQGKNALSDYEDTVVAAPGEQVVWRIKLENVPTDRSYVARNVVLTDIWPTNFELDSSVPLSVSTSSTATYELDIVNRAISWYVGDLERGDSYYFYLTGTVKSAPDACSEPTVNNTGVSFGCDNNCTSTEAPQDSAELVSRPDLSLSMKPGWLPVCGDEITVTVKNAGARAYSTSITVTLPSVYVYSETTHVDIPLDISTVHSISETVWLWEPTDGITGATNSEDPYEFDLVFQVKNNVDVGTCSFESSIPVTVDIGYHDSPPCIATGLYRDSYSRNIAIRQPDLNINKSPTVQVKNDGEVISWSISLTNSGNADVDQGLIITDIVGSNFDPTTVEASLGSDGSVPTINKQTDGTTLIKWETLSTYNLQRYTGTTWTASVTATIQSWITGTSRNYIAAKADCATGCNEYAVLTDDIAYQTMLDSFIKTSNETTVTIGSLIVYDIQADLSNLSALYRNLIITDDLPINLGYVSSNITYTHNIAHPTPEEHGTASTTSPSQYDTGQVVWKFGNLSGTVKIRGKITTVVRNIAENKDGITLTNDITMTYNDDTIPYVFTTTAGEILVAEPILHIAERYELADGRSSALLTENFNDNSAGGITPSGTWVVNNNTYVNTDATGVHTATFGDGTWTDTSTSFMMKSPVSSTGTIGGFIRGNGTTSGYRFEWDETNGMRLVDAATGNSIATRYNHSTITTNAGFTPDEWYHVEMTAVGDQIQVYVNNELVLSATNSTYTSGTSGFYSENNDNSTFDDLHVTRLGDMSHYVGANDLITYSMFISNQGMLPAYDLVVTNSIPSGLHVVGYQIISDDTTINVTQAPSVGDDGELVWNFSHLTPTIPFVTDKHTGIEIILTLQVADSITANSYLQNQSQLVYTNLPEVPDTVNYTRNYQGGSHSDALRTVNGGITKTVTFSPQPTATLGTLVTYTLIAPLSPISATMYNVVITDQLNTPLFLIEAVTTTGGYNPTVISNTNTGLIQVNFDSISHSVQAYITVTARISHEFPATGDPNSGDLITNSATMSHTTAPLVTSTNVVTTKVGEPRLVVAKTGAVSTADPQTVNYTVTVTNTGNAIAYGPLLIQDYAPADVSISGITPNGAVLTDGRTISWTLSGPLAVNGSFQLNYNLTISEPIYTSDQFVNTAMITNTSLTKTIPGVRQYVTNTVFTLTWPLGRIGNYVWYDFDYDGVQDYNADEFPFVGVVVDLYNADTGVYITSTSTNASGNYYFENLPLGVTYTVQLSETNFNVGHVLDIYSPTLVAASVTMAVSDSNASPTQTFKNMAGNQFGYAITTSLTAIVTEDLTLDYGFARLVEIGDTVWFDVNQNGIQDENMVDYGQSGVTITVTYGDGRAFTTTTIANGIYTFSVPISNAFTVTVLAENFAPGGPLEIYTTTYQNEGSDKTADSNGKPDPAGLIIYTGPVTTNTFTFDFGLLLDITPSIAKSTSFEPLPDATLGTTVTYIITVPQTLITRTLDNVYVTDTIDSHLEIVNVVAPYSGAMTINGQKIVVTYSQIAENVQRFITITSIISDPRKAVAGNEIPNVATLRYDSVSGAVITQTNTVTTSVLEPELTLDKSSNPISGTVISKKDVINYRILITNSNATTVSTAYGLIVTDTIPTGMRKGTPILNKVSKGGGTVANSNYNFSYVTATGIMVIDFIETFTMPRAAILQIDYTVTADDNLTDGLILTNIADLIYSSMQNAPLGERVYTDSNDNTFTSNSPLLTITKVADPNPVQAGQLLTYTLSYTLSGGNTAQAVVITDTVPTSSTFVSASPVASVTSQPAMGTVNWSLGDLDLLAGDVTGLVTMVVRVDEPLLTGTILSNFAELASFESYTNTTMTSSVVSTHALRLQKSDSPDPVSTGYGLTYYLDWEVIGNGVAQGVTISDTVPDGTTYSSCSGAPCTQTGGVVSYTLGDQPAGTTGRVQLNVNVHAPVGAIISNTAFISSTENQTATSIATTEVTIRPANLTTWKSVSPGTTRPDGIVTYRLSAVNWGPSTASNVTIVDTLPKHLTFGGVVR